MSKRRGSFSGPTDGSLIPGFSGQQEATWMNDLQAFINGQKPITGSITTASPGQEPVEEMSDIDTFSNGQPDSSSDSSYLPVAEGAVHLVDMSAIFRNGEVAVPAPEDQTERDTQLKKYSAWKQGIFEEYPAQYVKQDEEKIGIESELQKLEEEMNKVKSQRRALYSNRPEITQKFAEASKTPDRQAQLSLLVQAKTAWNTLLKDDPLLEAMVVELNDELVALEDEKAILVEDRDELQNQQKDIISEMRHTATYLSGIETGVGVNINSRWLHRSILDNTYPHYPQQAMADEKPQRAAKRPRKDVTFADEQQKPLVSEAYFKQDVAEPSDFFLKRKGNRATEGYREGCEETTKLYTKTEGPKENWVERTGSANHSSGTGHTKRGCLKRKYDEFATQGSIEGASKAFPC